MFKTVKRGHVNHQKAFWLVWLSTFIVVFFGFLSPCLALELVISDTGRNHSWLPEPALEQGANFSIVGADQQPIGGVLGDTDSLQQFLIPMPTTTELEQMSRGQEHVWVKNLANLLKDRVHIAITNKADLFEIRVLQSASPAQKNVITKEKNQRLRRFARMTFTAIGGLVAHVQERNTPIRITVAVADSGATSFTQAIDSWMPYRAAFRRIDFIDANVNREDLVKVIKAVGGKRVRIFNTAKAKGSLASTMDRDDVTEELLATQPGLTVYTLRPQTSGDERTDPTPWITSLRGTQEFRVQRFRLVDGTVKADTLSKNLTGQIFRPPLLGWDPGKLVLNSKETLRKLGVGILSRSINVIPQTLPESESGFKSKQIVGATADKKALDIHVTDFGINQWNNELEMFSDFEHAENKVFGHIPKSGQIALVMPEGSNYRFQRMSELEKTQYKQYLFNGLLKKVERAMQSGQKEIEIQIIQNINRKGYVHPLRQLEVKEFTNHAYVAIGYLNHYLTNKGHRAYIDGHFGSNGTETFAKNTDSWRGYMGKAVLYDGRASIDDTKVVIETLGEKRVKIVNTKGDLWAPPGSIANHFEVKRHIKSEYPEVTLLLLVPQFDGKVHVQSMNESKVFVGKEYGKRGYKNLGRLSGQDIRDAPMTPREKALYNEYYRTRQFRRMDPHDRKKDISYSKWLRQRPLKLWKRETPRSTVIVPSNTVTPQQVSRFVGGSGKIILRDKTRLDLRQEAYDKNIRVSYDRLGIKSPRQEDVVFRSFSIEHPEDNKSLGEVTRGSMYSSNDLSMKSGFDTEQKARIGDLPDFNRLRGRELGGVMFSTPARIRGKGDILNTGNVSLIFQDSKGVVDFLKLQRFITALWGTYLSVEGPGISIDPARKSFKEHGDTHQVRYIGQVRNTELAKVMREADHLMKRWAVGTHRPDIESFKSPEQFNRELETTSVSDQASRFWFVPQGLTFKRSDNILLFSKGRMAIQTEYLEDNTKGEKNEANERFAKWFTENYEDISKKYPIFRELFEYAKLVSLGTYLREHRFPMLWFLIANRELILTEESLNEVAQLVKQSGHQWYVKVYGGVEFELGDVVHDDGVYQDDATLELAEGSLAGNSAVLDRNRGPVMFSTSDTSYTVASGNTLKLFDSSAKGDTLQTDLALADAYEEHASKKDKWHLIVPRMELVRYYNPKLESRAQFGDGWHLLVPFRLESEYSLAKAPNRIVIVNLLSGIREELRLDERSGSTDRYVPEEEESLTDSLVHHSDGSWVLRDILGAKFVFDQDGDLQKMMLRDDHEIMVKLGEKTYRKHIPGYLVEYRYGMRDISGSERKVLTSIKQSGHTARISWHPYSNVPQIVRVSIRKQGQVGTVEVLNYEYNEEGRLAQVKTKSGRSVSLAYGDDHMQVLASGK